MFIIHWKQFNSLITTWSYLKQVVKLRAIFPDFFSVTLKLAELVNKLLSRIDSTESADDKI